MPKDSPLFGLNDGQVGELMDRARKAYDRASSFWNENYREMEEDMRMYAARDMWSEEARNARLGRPVLQFPVLKKFVKRTVGDTMRNPPGVKISPRRESEVRKAEIGMGLVRYIEDTSNAKEAYVKAFTDMVTCGIGWFRVTFSSRKRKIEVRKVSDPLYYMLDPDSENADGSDANFVISRTEKVKHDMLVILAGVGIVQHIPCGFHRGELVDIVQELGNILEITRPEAGLYRILHYPVKYQISLCLRQGFVKSGVAGKNLV